MLQIMMAATYPLEVVQAQRWLEANPGLSGEKLEEALKGMDWDVSVKSLCNFREVVKRMNDNLDWTQDMGDAFLAQQNDLLEAVQRMRAKAMAEGKLESTEQQTIVVKEQVVVIEPADPQVVYVPTYYPTAVYGGGWYYPWRYPALYAPAPVGWGAMTFAAGVWAGAAMYSHCNWHNDYHGGSYNNKVNIDVDVHDNYVNRTNNRDRAQQNSMKNRGGNSWNHDPSHRRGVNYKSPSTANRYGGTGTRGPVSKDTARGRDRASTGAARPSTRPSTGGSRPTARPSTSGSKARTSDRSSSSARRDSAMGGSRQSSMDRSARSRGQASRSGYSGGSRGSYSRPSGGGSRSSGSRGGGSRGGGSRGGGSRGGGGRR
ncbi:MAG: DUF3300 domain-containing protein [Planctomycetes bacterium]|nr:DUF3300 domain-containing protein [Planctomycetota bacterium]